MKPRLLNKLAPLVIVLVGFALRLFRLGADSLWYDETVSVLLARSDVAELLRHTAGDIHPPFYYLLLHVWGRFAGWSEFAAAFLSLGFGVLLIALVYHVAHTWYGRAVALLAAVLICLSPYNIWYSQEVRMYTLGAALGLVSVFALWRLLARPAIRSWEFFFYVLATTLGLYTLYYFAFLIVFEYICVIYYVTRFYMARRRDPSQTSSPVRPLWTTLIASQLALAILYLPWLPIAFRQATDPPVPPWREFVALPRVLLESYSALALGQAVEPLAVLPFILLLALPLAVPLLIRTRTLAGTRPVGTLSRPERSPSPWFLLGCVLVPLAAIFLLSIWKPLYHVRYMFTYSPAFYLLAALGLVRATTLARDWEQSRSLALALRALVGLAAAGWLALGAYSLWSYWYSPAYAEDDLRAAVTFLAERWRPGDAILVNAGYAYPAVVYYFPQDLARTRLTNPSPPPGPGLVLLQTGSIGGAPSLGWGDPRSDFYSTTADETRAALERVFAAHPRVWVLRIYDTVVDPGGVIRAYLAADGQLFEDQPFTGESQVRVQGYLSPLSLQLPAAASRLDAPIGDRVTLAGVELPPGPLRPGATYDPALYWQLREPVNFNYQLSLQILDASGAVVAQTDETPLGELLPMTRWRVGQVYREPVRVPLPVSLAPGQYSVLAKLYNLRDGSLPGPPVPLGPLLIQP